MQDSRLHNGYFKIEEEMKIENLNSAEEFIINEVVLKNDVGLEM